MIIIGTEFGTVETGRIMFNNHVRVGKSTDSRYQEKHKYQKEVFLHCILY